MAPATVCAAGGARPGLTHVQLGESGCDFAETLRSFSYIELLGLKTTANRCSAETEINHTHADAFI